MKKTKYEAPETQCVEVEMESEICAPSKIHVNPGDDISDGGRHVEINEQIDGGRFGSDTWTDWGESASATNE